ncbi:MAG: cyanophycin synthetase [bacterium]
MPGITELLLKIAPKIGAKVLIEPEWGYVGQIAFRSGRKRYFRFSSVDVNTLGASEVAKDKDFANFFMKHMGYPIVKGKTFFRDDWAETIRSKRKITAAYRYARRLGFPVIVKPNSGSQGKAVCLARTKRQFYRGMRATFEVDKVALVQIPVSGKDYRIVVLDREIISAYYRVPLSVVGNGKASVAALLKSKQKEFRRAGRDTAIRADDPRIAEKLEHQGLSFASVLRKDQKVFLLDNANLSTGGESEDVTESVHKEFRKIAVSLTRDMGLRLCGVDLMIDGDISEPPKTYWVLEVNSAPGLDHYAKSGAAQNKIVEKMYTTVLKSLDRD